MEEVKSVHIQPLVRESSEEISNILHDIVLIIIY
jgi:hypothetical protein